MTQPDPTQKYLTGNQPGSLNVLHLKRPALTLYSRRQHSLHRLQKNIDKKLENITNDSKRAHGIQCEGQSKAQHGASQLSSLSQMLSTQRVLSNYTHSFFELFYSLMKQQSQLPQIGSIRFTKILATAAGGRPCKNDLSSSLISDHHV